MKLTATRIVVRMALAACFAMVAAGTSLAETKETGTSKATTRQEATAALPYRYLRPEQARVVHAIVNKPTIYRRLPIKTIDCDHEMFTFLMRNPEVVIGIWQNMGVTQLSITRSGAHSFEASDGMGTVSQFRLLHGTPRTHLYYGTGYYEGPLLKRKIRGNCVLLVRTAYRRSAQGRMAITNAVDVFVDLENSAVDLAAKTLYPLFIRAADENLVTTANFLGQLSYSAEMNPQKITRLAGQLRQVNPDVRAGFVTVVQAISNRRSLSTQISAAEPNSAARGADAVNHVRYQRPMSAQFNQVTRPSQTSDRETSRPDVIISRYPPEFPSYR